MYTLFCASSSSSSSSGNTLSYLRIGESENPPGLPDGTEVSLSSTEYLPELKNNAGGLEFYTNNSKHMEIKENGDVYVTDDLFVKNLNIYDKIVDLSGSEGDLIVFDPYGFHGKHPCIEERRTIMFEFQPKHTDYPKSQIDFNGALLTKKVLSNIEIFIHNYKKNDHYLDDYKNNYVLNFRILFKSIVSSLKLVFRKKKSEFFLKVRKKLSKSTD